MIDTLVDLPEKCRVCGWMTGLRPSNCYGDEEHVMETIPTEKWTVWQRDYVHRQRVAARRR